LIFPGTILPIKDRDGDNAIPTLERLDGELENDMFRRPKSTETGERQAYVLKVGRIFFGSGRSIQN
jgi:hypothetical protein